MGDMLGFCIIATMEACIQTGLIPANCGYETLFSAAVLQAYIKRRSNMELLAAAGTLTVVELASAVTESLDYMRLCGVNTATSAVGTGSHSADMVIAAYEHIEAIAEESLDTLSDTIVALRSAGKQLVVRTMLKAENFAYETNGHWQDGAGFSRKVTIAKENQDMIIVLTFTEGGERKGGSIWTSPSFIRRCGGLCAFSLC